MVFLAHALLGPFDRKAMVVRIGFDPGLVVGGTQSPGLFTVAYVVRAVSPGSYVMPQAYVEDMYRPDRFGRTGTGRIEITAAR
jgi:hypothetical protein